MYKNQKHWLNEAITDGHINVIQNTSLQHVELIAEGTFGKVSTAYLPNLGNLVVIKPLFDHNIDLNDNNDPYFLNYHQSYNDFVQDMKKIKSIRFHDNIIRFYGITLGG
nr:9173_t:CDS:2 [Entrophospora candida]